MEYLRLLSGQSREDSKEIMLVQKVLLTLIKVSCRQETFLNFDVCINKSLYCPILVYNENKKTAEIQ